MTEIERIADALLAKIRPEIIKLLTAELTQEKVTDRIAIEGALAAGEDLYAVGYRTDSGGYDMVCGPGDLGDCMSYWPNVAEGAGRDAYILKLLPPAKVKDPGPGDAQFEQLYVWNWKQTDWKKIT